MKIQLSDHFSYGRLLRFIFPSIVMMIFTSIYGVVDGFFVSNYVGKTPFAAVSLIFPVLMIFGSLGFMVGTGGSALVAITMGMGEKEKANRYFSMLVCLTILAGIILTILGISLMHPIVRALGAEGSMAKDCVLYGRIVLLTLTAFLLQNVFQSFFITAEKPQLGLAVTIAAGCTNMLLDFFLVAVFRLGIAGAALATGISQIVGGILPLFYFAGENGSILRLTKAGFDKRAVFQACANGSSELMSNVSMSLVNILYNFQLIRLAGEDGVAAYGVIQYVNFIFVAIFLGYSIGSAPVIGYHYGSGNDGELKSLFKKSLVILGTLSAALTLLAEIAADPLVKIFVGYDETLKELTRQGFQIYSLSFLFCGFNIFGSSFFTALGNGAVSAAISFLRTLVFQVIAVLALPQLLGADGIWLAIVAAEALALSVTIWFWAKKRGRYRYA